MRTIMSRSPHEGSFSFSRRHFNLHSWLPKKHDPARHDVDGASEIDWDDDGHVFFAPDHSDAACHAAPTSSSSSSSPSPAVPAPPKRRRSAVSRLRAAFAAVLASSTLRLLVVTSGGGGGKAGFATGNARVTGTVFGPRRGRVHLSFQPDPRSPPLLLLELSTPTSSLVSEMASGLVRIALECDRTPAAGGDGRKRRHLLEEPLWRAYCNGRKLGTAARRDPLESDLDVLRKVGPVSMGAGVVARSCSVGGGSGKPKGDQVMYMRAGFERVVGSPDSMAFYMVGPEVGGGASTGPELSIYLLRV